MTDRRFKILARAALVAAFAGSLGGCDTLSGLNPFGEKEKPLAGERRPVPRVTPPPPDTVPQPLTALPVASSSTLA